MNVCAVRGTRCDLHWLLFATDSMSVCVVKERETYSVNMVYVYVHIFKVHACSWECARVCMYIYKCVGRMCGVLKAWQDNTSLFLISLILAHPDTPHALSVTLLPLITNLIVSPPRQVRAVWIKVPLPSFSLSYASLSSSTTSYLLLALLLLLIICSFCMEWVSEFKWPERFNVFTYLHLAIELLTLSIYVYKLQTLTCKCGGCLTGLPYSLKRGHRIGQQTSLFRSICVNKRLCSTILWLICVDMQETYTQRE